MARRRRHFVKRAIDAVTNLEFVFERLEMDVARAILDRLVQDQIDEANDRRGVRFGFDIGRGSRRRATCISSPASPSCLRMSSMLEVSVP